MGGAFQVVTDPDGSFRLDVEPGDYNLVVSSTGYSTAFRSTHIGGASVAEAVELSRATEGRFDSCAGTRIAVGGAELVVPRHAFDLPEGTEESAIDFSVTFLPYERLGGAQTTAGSLELLGVIDAEFYLHGEPVEIAQGRSAELILPLPGYATDFPGVLTAYYFDEELFQWVREGQGTVESTPEGPIWRGFVSHFTHWSMVEPYDCGEDICSHDGRFLSWDHFPNGSWIPKGTRLERAYQEWGIIIRAQDSRGGGGAVAFNSDDPHPEDRDLGTPNREFGGPGVGVGGETTNDERLFNLLIVDSHLRDSNRDNLIDDPNDAQGAGSFWVDFDQPWCVHSLTLVDIDRTERSSIRAYDGGGALLHHIEQYGGGNNSVTDLDFEVCGVRQLNIENDGSGAIDNIKISQRSCRANPEQDCGPPVCTPTAEVCDGEDNDCDEDIDEGDVCDPECVPQEEVCDGEDNDCDDDIDEGGVCGPECVPQEEVCDGEDNDCDDDIDEDGVCEVGCVVEREVCDGIDNDCDNLIDENTCATGSICATLRSGVTRCVAH